MVDEQVKKMNQCPIDKMDNEALMQMELKSLVEPTINFLDRLDKKSQSNAIYYLINVLKVKFPDSCEEVLHSLYPLHRTAHLGESQESKKNIKFILNTKNEFVKSENVASTDLNQNFEKILCKEEFMTVDKVEKMELDQNNEKILSKTSTGSGRSKYNGSLFGSTNSIALGGLPSNALLNAPDIGCENILSCDSIRANKLSQSSQVRISSAMQSNYNSRNSCHPNSELTVFYHHSSVELYVRAFKKQFLFRLEKHKSFLSKFYKDFVRTGVISETQPTLRILGALKAQRKQEWRLRNERKQLALQWREEDRLNNDIGFESHAQLPSFMSQASLRFDEVFDKVITDRQLPIDDKATIIIEDILFVKKEEIDSERKTMEQNAVPMSLSMDAESIFRINNCIVAECSNNLTDELRMPPEGNISSTINGLMSTSNINMKLDVSMPAVQLGISEVDALQTAVTSKSDTERENSVSIMNQQPLQNYRSSFSVQGNNIVMGEEMMHQRLTASSVLDSLDKNLYDSGVLSQISTRANIQPSQSPNFNSCSQDCSLWNDPYQEHQQQHMLMHQQQLSVSCAASYTPIGSAIVCGAPSSSSSYSEQHTQNFGLEDNELSHEEDDEDNELDELEPKQQLIDGGSSSSTSLQAPVGTNLRASCGMGIVKKAKPSYNCLLCPKSYRKRKSLLDHYKIHPGYCHDCGQPNGTTLEEIIQHNRTVHFKEFPFVCETCGESYSRRQQFHAHVESHSKKEFKSYSCVECDLKFQGKKLHQQHLDDTVHRAANGAICEVCGAVFASKNALYQHIIRVHKKDNFFECHICRNRFSLKANLERHVQLHTEIKRTYVCDLCGSSYFTQPALKDHYSNAHTDTSECKCTLCGKRFGSVKSLQRHLPSHSEERPHCCNYCDQTFKWKTHLVRHKQTVHGNQPSPKKVKRFSKVDEELVPVPDMPRPPPSKIAKKSNSVKGKQPQEPQQESSSQSGAIPTSPPRSSTPKTPQQEQFNAAVLNSNSSQSSTASTSQHSLSTNDSQQHQQQQSNSMYSQNFNSEKSVVHPQKQQIPQIQCGQGPGQGKKHPTPPPLRQHPLHTPNNMLSSEGGFISRMNNFAPFGHDTQQYHFEQSTPTNAASYQQQQQQPILNLYQQHNPQPPTPFSHHIPPTHRPQSQTHHQQLLQKHQLQQQQQQQSHRRNQQRSPHHNYHPTQAQQLQLQHSPAHSPQHHARLQSPPPRPTQRNSPRHQQQHQQPQQQQPQYQPCGPSLQQQYHTANDTWRGFSASTPVSTPGASNLPHQQNPNDVKDNSNKFYIVDSAEFFGLPFNIANPYNGRAPGPSSIRGVGTNGTQQQPQQQQQPGITNKQPESSAIGADVISFQIVWPSQRTFGNPGDHQQQQKHQTSSSNPNQTTADASCTVGGDMHSYNNIGSIFPNLIDNTPSTMEYNFDLMQPGSSAPSVSQADQQQQQQHQQQQRQHQSQQLQSQEHSAPSDTFGLQQPPGVSSLARSYLGVYGSKNASIYDTHQQNSPLCGIPEHQQQKNSFQPYHPNVLQPHATLGVGHPLAATAHHPLVAAHLLPSPGPHPSVYQRSESYPGVGEEPKTSLPPITDYMHHMHQQHQQLSPPHVQQTPEHLLYYHPVKND